MSAVANWSYTARATVWPLIGRDDKTGKLTFGLPVVIDCGYGCESKTVFDGNGRQLVSNLTVYTEWPDGKRGDYVALGEYLLATDPLAAKAREVAIVERYEDTFGRVADDYALVTI